MSTERMKILVPPPVETPRGALWAAAFGASILNGVRRIKHLPRPHRVSSPAQRGPIRLPQIFDCAHARSSS